jgi:endonuclease/exonuclease/phosphatase family metal-dependent hydrolase
LKNVLKHRLSAARLYFFFFLLLVAGTSQGCVSSHALVARDTDEVAVPGPVAWFGPSNSPDRALLARWRKSVGPPAIRESSHHDELGHDAITVVSWNTAVGDADIVGFVRALGEPRRPLVLLLQEVYREGTAVPARIDAGSVFARHLGEPAPDRAHREIEEVASTLGMALYYVPSMRNGGASSDEDRGNAILSDLPLADLRAIELPFERQRRVAVAANIAGRTAAGVSWSIRVVSAHLDNVSGLKRAWIASEYGRARQARGLVSLLADPEPTVLAGDFNTWFGFDETAYRETARAFRDTRVADRRATFGGVLRLDHIFSRLAPGWELEFHRAESRFESDHYPLVGTLRFH